MRRFEVVFSVLFSATLLIFNAGCVHTRSYYSRYVEAPEGKAFFSPAPHFDDAAFFGKGAESYSEGDKIRYLLTRMADSNDHFIRNGKVYNGKEARQWLLFKLSRWSGEVKTARDFVIHLSFSKQSGKPYLVESSKEEIYSLKSILKNELSAFEDHIARGPQVPQEALSQPAKVSLSPTAVATTAVAHSTS